MSGRPERSGEHGFLGRLTHRLTTSSHDYEAAALLRESDDLGVTRIGDAPQRTLVTICGEVRSVTLRPREEIPALEVELWDGSDSLHLIWLGRRRIVGIVPGIKLQATGRITKQHKHSTIFNPAYEILGRVGASRE